jgi:hypothetical protein
MDESGAEEHDEMYFNTVRHIENEAAAGPPSLLSRIFTQAVPLTGAFACMSHAVNISSPAPPSINITISALPACMAATSLTGSFFRVCRPQISKRKDTFIDLAHVAGLLPVMYHVSQMNILQAVAATGTLMSLAWASGFIRKTPPARATPPPSAP